MSAPTPSPACLGLAVFHTLCDAANTLDGLRERCVPGSDPWCALCELVQTIDSLIDRLVQSPALEEERGAAREAVP